MREPFPQLGRLGGAETLAAADFPVGKAKGLCHQVAQIGQAEEGDGNA